VTSLAQYTLEGQVRTDTGGGATVCGGGGDGATVLAVLTETVRGERQVVMVRPSLLALIEIGTVALFLSVKAVCCPTFDRYFSEVA
jgi:hypothetical protein